MEFSNETGKRSGELLGALHSRIVMGRRIRSLSKSMARVIPNSSSLLDVGSGNGRLAAALLNARPDLSIQGVDTLLWPEQHIPTKIYDGKSIPLDDSEVDYCIASDVLHHCEDPVLLLREMLRVCSKGLVIKDHIAETRLDNVVLGIMDWAGNAGHGVALKYDYWPWSKWCRVFSELGLEIEVLIGSLHLYPRPFTWVLDNKLHFLCLLKMRHAQTDLDDE